MPKVEIAIYTDPYCTWCWGSEPILRHLEEAYGDQIQFRNVMGGLVEDISQFHDASNNIGGPDFAKQVAEHWDEASGKHGMPVDSSQWTDTLNEFTSTHPACQWRRCHLGGPGRRSQGQRGSLPSMAAR